MGKRDDYITAANKLADYEDAQEIGRLVMLPCAVGDTAYIADNWEKAIFEYKIREIAITGDGAYCYSKPYTQPITPDLWGKTAFLTYEEAEKALED